MTGEDRARFILWWDVTGGGNTSLRAVAEQAWISATRIEREACAKVCESLFDPEDDSCNEAEACASAIRARSNTP